VGWTSLHQATAWRREAACRELVTRFPLLLEEADQYGWQPLHLACLAGDFNIIGLLLAAGANVHATDRRGRTPLHLAAESATPDNSRLLLLFGASTRTRDHSGRRPDLSRVSALASRTPRMVAKSYAAVVAEWLGALNSHAPTLARRPDPFLGELARQRDQLAAWQHYAATHEVMTAMEQERFVSEVGHYLQATNAAVQCPLFVCSPDLLTAALLAARVAADPTVTSGRQVLYLRVGATPLTTTVPGVLNIIRRWLQLVGSLPPSSDEEEVTHLRALWSTTTTTPLMLVLEMNSGAANSLAWLPVTLPPSVKMLIACATDQPVEKTLRTLPKLPRYYFAPRTPFVATADHAQQLLATTSPHPLLAVSVFQLLRSAALAVSVGFLREQLPAATAVELDAVLDAMMDSHLLDIGTAGGCGQYALWGPLLTSPPASADI
jgi:hypothetical protein